MTAATITTTSIICENYLLYAFLRTRQQDGVIAHRMYGKGCNLPLVCRTHLADALAPHGNANVVVIVIIMEHIGDSAAQT